MKEYVFNVKNAGINDGTVKERAAQLYQFARVHNFSEKKHL